MNNDLYGSEDGYEGGGNNTDLFADNQKNQDKSKEPPTMELIKLQRKNTDAHNHDAITDFLKSSAHHPDSPAGRTQ